MTMVPFICMYREYLPTFLMLSLEERGNLATAMMEYAEDPEFKPNFLGNEKYIWPTIRLRIDRDIQNYEDRVERNRRNGAKGGRPPKKKSDLPEEKTHRYLEKPNENENENDNQIYSESKNESKNRSESDCREEQSRRSGSARSRFCGTSGSAAGRSSRPGRQDPHWEEEDGYDSSSGDNAEALSPFSPYFDRRLEKLEYLMMHGGITKEGVHEYRQILADRGLEVQWPEEDRLRMGEGERSLSVKGDTKNGTSRRTSRLAL